MARVRTSICCKCDLNEAEKRSKGSREESEALGNGVPYRAICFNTGRGVQVKPPPKNAKDIPDRCKSSGMTSTVHSGGLLNSAGKLINEKIPPSLIVVLGVWPRLKVELSLLDRRSNPARRDAWHCCQFLVIASYVVILVCAMEEKLQWVNVVATRSQALYA